MDISYDRLKSLNYQNKDDLHLILSVFVILTGLILRLIFSLTEFGLIHPDEIYQSQEMAHVIVFGSGDVPPEFLSVNPREPSYAAARSWIFPYIFAAIMWIGKILGLNYFSVVLPMIRIFLAINSTLLLPAVYKLSKQLTNDKWISLLSMAFLSYWVRIIEYGTRSLTNSFFAPYVIYGIFIVLHGFEKEELNLKNIIIVGLCLGLTTYIRVDLGIIVFAFFFFTFSIKYLKHYIAYTVSGICAWLLGAYIDYVEYDGAKFFSVPINWFTFNFIEGKSEIFGVSGPLYYITHVLLADLIGLFTITILISSLYYTTKPSIVKENDTQFEKEKNGFFLLLNVVVIVWFIYSFPAISNLSIQSNPFDIILVFDKTHKEVRFIYMGIVSYVMLCAFSVKPFARYLATGLQVKDEIDLEMTKSGFNIDYDKYIGLFLVILLIFFSISVYSINPAPNRGEQINEAFMEIGKRNNADNIIVFEVWFIAGQQTFLHEDTNVDIFFISPNDINEYYYQNRINETIKNNSTINYIVIPQRNVPIDYYIYNMMEEQNYVKIGDYDGDWGIVELWSSSTT